jgi:hypothetical protein
MTAAAGDQRRRKEAMELLVNELSRGDEEAVVNSLRAALEVYRVLKVCLLSCSFREDGSNLSPKVWRTLVERKKPRSTESVPVTIRIF